MQVDLEEGDLELLLHDCVLAVDQQVLDASVLAVQLALA